MYPVGTGSGTVGHGGGTVIVSSGVGLPVCTVGVVGVTVTTVDVPAGVPLSVSVGGGGTVAVCWTVTLACGREPGRDSV